MTLYLPAGASAIAALRREGTDRVAGVDESCPGRPRHRIALLNLMPDKPATEIHFARQLAHWPGDIELVLVRPASYVATRSDPVHLRRYYTPAPAVLEQGIDGLIVTGAPVEHLPFEEVLYWRELTAIIDDAAERQLPCLYICWAGQAALYHRYSVPKHRLPQKAFGVFPQTVERPDAPVLHGLGANFLCPVSRHTEVRRSDLPRGGGLRVLAASPLSGLCLVEDRHTNALMMFNHPEYDSETLIREYLRDKAANSDIAPPVGVEPGNGRGAATADWQAAATLFFGNWLDHAVGGDRRNAAPGWAGAPTGRPTAAARAMIEIRKSDGCRFRRFGQE